MTEPVIENISSQPLDDDHDCPYMGVRSCCSTDFCEDCICYEPTDLDREEGYL